MKKILVAVAAVVTLVLLAFVIWVSGSSNPETPAGYVGYLTQGAVFGKSEFYGMQKGPTSPGRTWKLEVVNVSITPYKFTENFTANDGVLSKDQLKLSVSVHIVFQIDEKKVREFVEQYSTLHEGRDPNKVVEAAYDNYLQPRLRAYLRDQIQKDTWQADVGKMLEIGKGLDEEMKALAKDSPFIVTSVVIDSIQPPSQVGDAVSLKLAAQQTLEQKSTDVLIAEKDAKRREAEAVGIANAMNTINSKLTSMYLQHEAIEAQKAMVGSPNHTTVYIPVGPMGVPIVGTLNNNVPPVSNQK